MSGLDDTETILVGDRRVRVRRRLPRRHPVRAGLILAVLLVLVAAGVGVVLFLKRPQGLAAVEGPAVVSSGAFQAKISADDLITVALEIRNVTDEPVSVVSARVVPPSGLTTVAIALLTPGERNENLNLDAELPPSAPITLGTEALARNGIVAARFQVDCDLLPTPGPTGEQIFVTVRLGDDEREEQLTPPVDGTTPWLTATARGACARPTMTGTPPPPLPTL